MRVRLPLGVTPTFWPIDAGRSPRTPDGRAWRPGRRRQTRTASSICGSRTWADWAGGAGDWPLLHDGTVDLCEGVPFGLTQHRLIVNALLIESNWLIRGRPGQGKTFVIRTLLLGADLNLTAEL